jgi:hypothetical protein
MRPTCQNRSTVSQTESQTGLILNRLARAFNVFWLCGLLVANIADFEGLADFLADCNCVAINTRSKLVWYENVQILSFAIRLAIVVPIECGH